jgi:Enterocin A Immunity.
MGEKWFATGAERGDEVVKIITVLLDELSNDPTKAPLEQVLLSYKTELEKRESSVPHILSRMNIAVANTMIQNHITLSQNQSDELKKAMNQSHIMYGY